MTDTPPARKIRQMTAAELETVLGWAADEGWNPGREDAQAFYIADPEGFFVAEVDGALAAAISVVNHEDERAFLGLYICLPAFRGQGHGFALWSAALRHAGARAVGLEGVPAQQQTYIRAGFSPLGRTLRFCGEITQDALGSPGTGLVAAADVPALVQADQRAVGYGRHAYCRAWFAHHATRQTRVLREGGEIIGHATFRICQEGVKIGPLHAQTQADAEALLQACPPEFPKGPLFIDVPEGAPLADMLRAKGFEPIFETAQMVRGTPPQTDLPPYYGLATLELG